VKEFRRVILYLGALFLIPVAVLKAVALLKGGVYLYARDSLLLIPNVYILWGTMICEFVLVWMIAKYPESEWTSFVFFSLGAQFMIYRTVGFLGSFSATCPCIGNMGKSLGISTSVEHFVLNFIAAWLTFGGALLVLRRSVK
jgi:hypothetical protein